MKKQFYRKLYPALYIGIALNSLGTCLYVVAKYFEAKENQEGDQGERHLLEEEESETKPLKKSLFADETAKNCAPPK